MPLNNGIMNTSTFSTHRSVEEMQKILNEREARKAAEQRAQELADREASASREEQSRIAREQQLDSSQDEINRLCQSADDHYNGMVSYGKDYIRNERKAVEKQKELNLFVETADEMYPVEEIDRSQEKMMKTRIAAYKSLPILDAVLAFFALYPIMTSKLVSETLPLSKGVLIGTGMAISIVMGVILAMVSRFAVAGINKNDSMKQKAFAFVSVLILPMMYIIGALVFVEGRGWTYNIVFAIVSLLIQCLIFYHFPNHLAAFDYFKKVKAINEQMAKREKHEQTIRGELQSISNERDRILGVFNQHYNDFCSTFRTLAVNYETHKRKFDKQPDLPLNQIVIMFGDMQVFQEERLPLKRRDDGSVATMSSSIVGGTENCFNELQKGAIGSLGIIDFMLRNANIGIPIDMPVQHTAIAEGQPEQNLIGEDNSDISQSDNQSDSIENDDDDIDMPEAWQ